MGSAGSTEVRKNSVSDRPRSPARAVSSSVASPVRTWARTTSEVARAGRFHPAPQRCCGRVSNSAQHQRRARRGSTDRTAPATPERQPTTAPAPAPATNPRAVVPPGGSGRLTGTSAGQTTGSSSVSAVQHIARQPAVGPSYRPGRRSGPRAAVINVDHRRTPGRLPASRQTAQTVQHLHRLPGRAFQILGIRAGWQPRRQPAVPASPRTGPTAAGVDHSALAVTWNRTIWPCTDPLARDQRRAIGQLRDHPVGQCRIGLGHDLRADTHIFRNRQAKERAVLGKGSQRLRLAPAHRAAHTAPPDAQAHGHQWRLRRRDTSLAASRGPAKRTSMPPARAIQ